MTVLTIVGSLLAIVVIILPAVVKAWQDKQTPKAQLDKLNEESDKAVVNGDVDAVNRIIHDGLVVPTSGSDSSGQGRKI